MGMWCRGLTCDPVKVETAGSNPDIPATEPPMYTHRWFSFLCTRSPLPLHCNTLQAARTAVFVALSIYPRQCTGRPSGPMTPVCSAVASAGSAPQWSPVGQARTLFLPLYLISYARVCAGGCSRDHACTGWTGGGAWENVHRYSGLPPLSARCNGQQRDPNLF